MQQERIGNNAAGRARRTRRLVLVLCTAASLAAGEAGSSELTGVAADAGVRAIDPVLIGDRLVTGFPLTHGRFNTIETKLGHLERIKSHVDLALHVDLAVLGQWPEVFDDDRIAYEYARRFLTDANLSRFVTGCRYGSCSTTTPYDGWAGENEFERADTWRAFTATYRPRLLSGAAEFPLRFVQVLKVGVQPYDEGRRGFPLRGQMQAPVLATVGTAAPLTIDVAWTPPTVVFVDRADAGAFLEMIEGPDRSAYLGLRVSLVEPDRDPLLDRPRLRLALDGATLYADPELRNGIHEFSLWGIN